MTKTNKTTEGERMTRRLQKGDKVRDRYGKVHEVRFHEGTMVYFADGTWAHMDKVHKV